MIRLAGDDGAPMPIQSNVDGAKLAAFIDAAVADSIRELEKREDDLSKAGVTMLENVDGKSMVEQMSPQFLEFVLDAYRSLKIHAVRLYILGRKGGIQVGILA